MTLVNTIICILHSVFTIQSLIFHNAYLTHLPFITISPAQFPSGNQHVVVCVYGHRRKRKYTKLMDLGLREVFMNLTSKTGK